MTVSGSYLTAGKIRHWCIGLACAATLIASPGVAPALAQGPTAQMRGAGTPISITPAPKQPVGLIAVGSNILLTPPVPIPSSPYQRPERLYVLPVFVAPKGLGHWLPDPLAPGFNLNGTTFSGAPAWSPDTYPVLYERAANNVSVHLQTARKMYTGMMSNPLNGKNRGTFELADWDANTGVARKVVSIQQKIDPLIMELANFDRADIVALQQVQPWATPLWVEEILDKIGCKRMSCPFVLSIVVVGNPFGVAHGAKWNYGYNNGGGSAFFNYATVLNSWSTLPDDEHTFLSTLVHELGHAFGMPHSDDYCNVVESCEEYQRFDSDLSNSIMSYNEANWIHGCPRTSALDATHCLLPDNRLIAQLPGVLEFEDKRIADANALVFPDFKYQPALDHPNPTEPVFALDAGGDWGITADDRLLVTSNDSHPSTARAPVVIGGYSERFSEIEQDEPLLTWVSSMGAAGTWAQYEIFLPEPITLRRLRVYGGYKGNVDRPTGLQLFVSGDPNVIAAAYNLPGANSDLETNRAGSHFILQMQRGTSGLARIRGLRIFGQKAGSATIEEFFGPAEPIATTPFGSTFGGSINNIVGSDQLLAALALPFQPSASWHSSERPAGSWVSVDVDLREETAVTGMFVLTGHTGSIHKATQIQIERECVCRQPYNGAGGACAIASASACAVAGLGERVYEVVQYTPTPPASEYVSFPARTARHWRIALKTADGPAGSTRWMVVRGLRFFTPDAGNIYELFPSRGTIQ